MGKGGRMAVNRGEKRQRGRTENRKRPQYDGRMWGDKEKHVKGMKSVCFVKTY